MNPNLLEFYYFLPIPLIRTSYPDIPVLCCRLINTFHLFSTLSNYFQNLSKISAYDLVYNSQNGLQAVIP